MGFHKIRLLTTKILMARKGVSIEGFNEETDETMRARYEKWADFIRSDQRKILIIKEYCGGEHIAINQYNRGIHQKNCSNQQRERYAKETADLDDCIDIEEFDTSLKNIILYRGVSKHIFDCLIKEKELVDKSFLSTSIRKDVRKNVPCGDGHFDYVLKLYVIDSNGIYTGLINRATANECEVLLCRNNKISVISSPYRDGDVKYLDCYVRRERFTQF